MGNCGNSAVIFELMSIPVSKIFKVELDEDGREKNILTHYEVACDCGYKNKMDEPTCRSIEEGTSEITCLECTLSLTEQYHRPGPSYQKPNPLEQLIPTSSSEWGWLVLFIIPVLLLLPGC